MMRVENGSEISIHFDEESRSIIFSKRDKERPYQKISVVVPKWNSDGTRFSLQERKDLVRSGDGALVNRGGGKKE